MSTSSDERPEQVAPSDEPPSPNPRRQFLTRALFRVGIALTLIALGSAVVGLVVTELSSNRSDLAANSAQALDATIIVLLTAVLIAAVIGRIRRGWCQRWRGPFLLGIGALTVIGVVSVYRYLPPVDGVGGTATLTAFYTCILGPVCLVAAVLAGRPHSTASTFPAHAQVRPILVAIVGGAAVAAVALTGFVLAQAVPDQARLADDSTLVGPIQLSFGVAVAVAIAAAVIVAVTRASDETVKTITLLLAVIGGVALAWLVMFRVPDALHTANDLGLAPGVHGPSPIALIGVIAAAAAGIASMFLVAEQYTRTAGTVRTIESSRVALALVACLVVGSAAAIGLEFQQSRPTSISAADDASPRAYPTVPGPVDYRIDLHDKPARSVVPTGNGFAYFDSDSLVAYDGATGAPRWRMDLALLDRTIPGRQAIQGLDNHRFLLANGSGRSSTLTMVGENDRIITLDATTGRVLWSTTDDIYFFDTSRRATSRDALVGVRELDDRTDVVSIDPRSGRTLWARPTSSNCSPRGDIIGTRVALTDLCQLRDAVAVVDARTGASQPITRVGHSGPITAEGDVFAIGPSTEASDDATTALIDPNSGAVVATLVGDQLLSPVRGGRYVAALRSGPLEIRSIASTQRIGLNKYFGPVTSSSPAVWIGELLYVVTTSSLYGPGTLMTGPRVPSVIGHSPLPCPPRSDDSSLVNVPGATLMLCAAQDRRGAYQIVGSGDSMTP